MTVKWYGYTQHPDADPARPWWHQTQDAIGGILARRGDFRIEVSWYWDRVKVERFSDQFEMLLDGGGDPSLQGQPPSDTPAPGKPCWQVLFVSRLHWGSMQGATHEESRAHMYESYIGWVKRIDREYPLPAPEPKPGQIWVLDGKAYMVVQEEWPWFAHIVAMDIALMAVSGEETGMRGKISEEWPVPRAVLVAGEDAPWAPPEKE